MTKIKKNNSGKVLLWIACVLSFIASVFNLLAIFAISFNWFNIMGVVETLFEEMGQSVENIDMTFTCIELAIVVLIDFYAGVRYLKINKHRYNMARIGQHLMWQSVLQILFGSFLAGIFACIGITILSKRTPMPITNEEKIEYFNEYKKRAMGEAISRLKELKAQGAISEEEYYETLNKILEG